MSPPPPPPGCPPCLMELRIRRLETDQATIRVRLTDVERNQEAFAVHLDKLGDTAQRLELVVARIEGAIDVISERPSTVIQLPEQRRSVSPVVSLGKGEWHLRLRGKAALLWAALALLVGAGLFTAGRLVTGSHQAPEVHRTPVD